LVIGCLNNDEEAETFSSTQAIPMKRITLVQTIIFCILAVAVGCSQSNPPSAPPTSGSPPVAASPPSQPTQFDINKHAFKRARLAATVESWDAAIDILDKIDTEKVDDADVLDYVALSRLCSTTAKALGVDRKSNPDSPTDVIAKIDWAGLVATLVKDPGKFISLVADAKKVRDSIPRYEELDAKLAQKYAE
jgi:hypothetical protein